MILVIKCFISNKTKEGFRPLLATEMKCANCKDGATKLVGGRCQDWCSKFGYCGATAAHKAGGTDCSQWLSDQQLVKESETLASNPSADANSSTEFDESDKLPVKNIGGDCSCDEDMVKTTIKDIMNNSEDKLKINIEDGSFTCVGNDGTTPALCPWHD